MTIYMWREFTSNNRSKIGTVHKFIHKKISNMYAKSQKMSLTFFSLSLLLHTDSIVIFTAHDFVCMYFFMNKNVINWLRVHVLRMRGWYASLSTSLSLSLLAFHTQNTRFSVFNFRCLIAKPLASALCACLTCHHFNISFYFGRLLSSILSD